MSTRRTPSWSRGFTKSDSGLANDAQIVTDTDPVSTDFNLKGNMLTPLYRLPDEVILRILLELQIEGRTDDKRFTAPYLSCMSTQWVGAMIICRRFREVAVSSSILWTFINAEIQSASWHKLCTSRSAERTLDVFAVPRPPTLVLSVGGSKYSMGMDARTRRAFDLIPQAHRLQLVIPDHFDPEEVDPDEDDNLKKVVDDLTAKYLNVEQPNLRVLELFNLSSHPIDLGSAFLGGECNSLSYLLLDGVRVQSELPKMPALRTFIMHRIPLDARCTPVSILLKSTPGITFLRIDHSGAQRPRTVETIDAATQAVAHILPVHLPSLQILHLHGTLFEIGRIVRLVPNPSHQLQLNIEETRVYAQLDHFHALMDESSRTIYTRLVSHLSRGAGAGFLAPHHSCSITFDPISGSRPFSFPIVDISPPKAHLPTGSQLATVSVHLEMFLMEDLNARVPPVNFSAIDVTSQLAPNRWTSFLDLASCARTL